MKYLIVFLLLILVVSLTANPCKRMDTKRDAEAREKCNNFCRKDRKCQRGVCAGLQGKKKCSCLDCDSRDHTRRWPYPALTFSH
ncbi:hypothetical protein ANCCEY_10054 [Ancylostoma ceylanicum]|uniref:Uncharacterized protein n=2 Tax=Ancylostoma ceylanicum TaxID=53326 RepID=A0A0D6LI42_9BILA|nr:hypothetical protein ANCCEY_10054 [Ancylostoma ceylanicum]EYC28879.1 hypothetical protein Y032_0007g3476 [Ancylostoma ceylanicum]